MLWQRIRTCALALAVIVSLSVFQSGSLRNALFLAWRETSAKFADTILGAPTTPVPTDEWLRDRTALESRLEVGAGTPKRLTTAATAVLSPFATAAITAIIPLGS